MQGYFIVPVAIFVSISSIVVIILPIVQEPASALIAVGTTLLGLPAYVFYVMKTPRRLKPKLFTRISSKLLKNTVRSRYWCMHTLVGYNGAQFAEITYHAYSLYNNIIIYFHDTLTHTHT